MAYRSNGIPNRIPGCESLIFDIELLEIDGYGIDAEIPLYNANLGASFNAFGFLSGSHTLK